jgi:hypothetical protein
MIFEKEGTRNLINMLKSSDADNHIIAFESLKTVDLDSYVGELLVMFKYTGHKLEYWQENCLPVYTKLMTIIPDKTLSSPATLSLITANKGSKDSIELFMEYFVRDMTKMLEQIGYPTDKFEINIKLKDNG